MSRCSAGVGVYGCIGSRGVCGCRSRSSSSGGFAAFELSSTMRQHLGSMWVTGRTGIGV